MSDSMEGDLPHGWRRAKIGTLCEFKYGKSLPDALRISGEIPVYGSNGRVGGHDQAITLGPTIIIGRKGSIGQVHLSTTPCYPIDTTYYVDEFSHDVCLEWLIPALRLSDLSGLNKASGVPGLNRDDVYKVEIPLPPLPEQKRIAAILNEQLAAVEKARRAAQEQLTIINALPKAYLRQAFSGVL